MNKFIKALIIIAISPALLVVTISGFGTLLGLLYMTSNEMATALDVLLISLLGEISWLLLVATICWWLQR